MMFSFLAPQANRQRVIFLCVPPSCLSTPISSLSLFFFCPTQFLFCSVTQSCLTVTPWTATCQASLSFTTSGNLLKLMSIELVMPSNHLVLCHPLLLLPIIFPRIRGFSNGLDLCVKWPKYWSFSISPSNEYSGLISFKIDWFDLAVQRTLKSLLQHHSLKAPVLQHLALFMA